MIFYHYNTETTNYLNDVRKWFPNKSLPQSITAEVLSSLGVEIEDVAEPVPTFEEMKEAKKVEINEAFKAHISGRTTISLGWDMQFDLKDIIMVDGAVRALEMTGGTEGYLTDADNINHYGLSVLSMKQAVLEMTMAHMQAHAYKQQLRDAVNAATTAEDLEVITWASA